MTLSIILAISDNFDLNDNLVEELNITLKNIFTFSKSEKVKLEIIIVNWNIISKQKTYQKLNSSIKPDNVKIQYIEVDNTLHNNYKLSHKIPFYLAHATNIGIRKAQSNAILSMKVGTFFSKKSWLNILKYVSTNQHNNSFLTLLSKATLGRAILKNDTYNISAESIKNNCIQELKDKKIIDYTKHRIHINRDLSFRSFDSLLFSKEKALHTLGFPELSVYPTLLTTKLFVANINKYYKEHLSLSAGYKIDYKEKSHFNPAEDSELKLAPDTEKILLDRIKKEKNSIIFNDENWGLKNIQLSTLIL